MTDDTIDIKLKPDGIPLSQRRGARLGKGVRFSCDNPLDEKIGAVHYFANQITVKDILAPGAVEISGEEFVGPELYDAKSESYDFWKN